MISFKGILKYLIYIFIAGWMFLLGIMVGRGSSPVNFDTRKFQKRLATIANEYGKKKGAPKKIDLKFYDVLDNPVPEEGVAPGKKHLEIIPKKQVPVTMEIPVLKTSRKKQTFKKKGHTVKPEIEIRQPKGTYTIQVAAYKDFKDAVTQMASLAAKGFSPYRVKGQKDGITWYRIRIGSFATYEEAKKFKEKLNKARINSLIIKRSNDEDIKG